MANLGRKARLGVERVHTQAGGSTVTGVEDGSLGFVNSFLTSKLKIQEQESKVQGRGKTSGPNGQLSKSVKISKPKDP